MDCQVSWSPEALEDVDAIATYIARDSSFYAAAVVQAILDAARTLKIAEKVAQEMRDEKAKD